MGNDMTMGAQCAECYCGPSGHYDKINTIKRGDRPKTKIMIKVEQQIDTYTTKMLEKKIREIMNEMAGNPIDITFPAPNIISPDEKEELKVIPVSPCDIDNILNTKQYLYELVLIDEYYGNLNYVHKYDNTNKYDPILTTHKSDALPIINTRLFDSTEEANEWFDDMIHKSLYSLTFDYDEKESSSMRNRPPLNYKVFNEWDDVNIKKLGAENEVVQSIFSGDMNDKYLTLLAFCGFAAHRTQPINPDQQHIHVGCYFVNDVSFLYQYQVKGGYNKYGAIAYFDNKYCISKIYVSYTQKTYTPDAYVKAEWEHAKWVWKVSVTVATFLVDMVAGSRFRETGGLIKAIYETLSPNHPVRRLLLPFTFGTAYANRVFNEYLKENGLFHRVFAFKYEALGKVMKDGMDNAEKLNGGGFNPNKYRFRLLKKKIQWMKEMPEEVCPIYKNVSTFWGYTLSFVDKYFSGYYDDENPDEVDKLFADHELKAFYEKALKYFNIASKFRFKKFNIVNLLAHFICNATIWDSHLSSSISFDYSIDPGFVGLKIVREIKGGMNQNTIQTYAEYCLTVLCKGWNLMSFNGGNNISDEDLEKITGYKRTQKAKKVSTAYQKMTDDPEYFEKNTIWSSIALNDEQWLSNREILNEYFKDNTKIISEQADKVNKTCIAPYHSMNPKYFSASVML